MNLADDKIIKILKATNNDIYLVGGVVRDYLLGKETSDKDIIVCDIPAKEFALKFANKNNATFVSLDEINNIYRVVMPDKINYIDVTNPVENSLEKDILRRDLTINAIAYSLRDDKLIDIVQGQKDIKNGIIRAISEENFIDDPLRILRAFRFASTLGYKIEDNTYSFMKRHYKSVMTTAKERQNQELIKLFGGKYAHEIILDMDKTGLLELLYPVIKDVKKVPENSHHHLDLFHHSVETVKQMQNIYENSDKIVKEHLERVDFGGGTRLAHLKLAGLLHDIGKFSTWTIENGRHRFIGHAEVGSEMVSKILKKDKFSKKQIDYIKTMVLNHMYPSAVVSSEKINDKIYMRYIRKAGDNSIDMITIAKADRLSARGVEVTEDMVLENISALNKLQDFYIEVKPKLVPIPKLLTGDEIMKLKNIPQSKQLGEIIKSLHEAQLDGIVKTKEDAVDFILSK